LFKLALPKGRLLSSTAAWLKRARLEAIDYNESSRNYRPQCLSFPGLFLKVFHERDIPIQVATGNYDLGVCGLDWVEELLVKYPSSSLVKLHSLGYGRSQLYLAASQSTGIVSVEEINCRQGVIRIASEYPNLAESFALSQRLRQFRIFPLWGAAEAYPPEEADLVLISLRAEAPQGKASDGFEESELVLLKPLLQSDAFLIANRHSWESKDISPLLSRLYSAIVQEAEVEPQIVIKPAPSRRQALPLAQRLRLALPDGHQQSPCFEFLERAGIRVLPSHPHHPTIVDFPDIGVKIIRPQDMPLQVAVGNFDLAITGQDWLYDHLSRFPSSPIRELVDLGFGKVKIVVAVSENLTEYKSPIRIASEYINIADKYGRDHHLGRYRIIPTWGASEAFLPEDADLLIENTQTGKTLAQHHLKIIDTLFESSACLIGNLNSLEDKVKRERINQLLAKLG
jgi:ATP phosphoribosyltransferase